MTTHGPIINVLVDVLVPYVYFSSDYDFCRVTPVFL